jgi:hypothetical protein
MNNFCLKKKDARSRVAPQSCDQTQSQRGDFLAFSLQKINDFHLSNGARDLAGLRERWAIAGGHRNG